MDVDLLRGGSSRSLGGAVKVPRLVTAEAAPAAPRQQRSIDKRARLLEAGRELFGERGYEATSIGDITARAETAAGAFYLYFASKRQLLVALMNELLERLAVTSLAPAQADDMQAALRRFVAALFETDLAYFGVIRAWQEAVATDAELRAMHARIEAWTGARILAVFRALQKHPRARAEGDLAGFARMMDRHFWGLLGRAGTLKRSELQREARVAADVIWRYLFA